MPSLTIAGTIIEFPDTGNSPIWSDAVIQFALAVESVLNGISNAYDVQPQVYNMVANVNTNIDLSALQFPTSNVRAAFVRYSVARTTSSTSAYEAGTLILDYNPDRPSTQKWDIQREYTGEGFISFSITDAGQVSFSTTSLAGTGHTGEISFNAQSLLIG